MGAAAAGTLTSSVEVSISRLSSKLVSSTSLCDEDTLPLSSMIGESSSSSTVSLSAILGEATSSLGTESSTLSSWSATGIAAGDWLRLAVSASLLTVILDLDLGSVLFLLASSTRQATSWPMSVSGLDLYLSSGSSSRSMTTISLSSFSCTAVLSILCCPSTFTSLLLFLLLLANPLEAEAAQLRQDLRNLLLRFLPRSRCLGRVLKLRSRLFPLRPRNAGAASPLTTLSQSLSAAAEKKSEYSQLSYAEQTIYADI